MESLLKSAIDNERNETYSFFLSGDLSQMSSQRSFLNRMGVETRQNNVYPCLKESDVPKALNLIWVNRVDGWWHYEDLYVKHSICTKEEFWTRLKRS